MNDLCDACGGTGKPVSGLPCICGGTGRGADEKAGLRGEILSLQEEIKLLELAELGNKETNKKIDAHARETNKKYLDALDQIQSLQEENERLKAINNVHKSLHQNILINIQNNKYTADIANEKLDTIKMLLSKVGEA